MKPSFKEILAERQAYIDTLKTMGNSYALGYLESSFVYDSVLSPVLYMTQAHMVLNH
jgi:hypothetical protein